MTHRPPRTICLVLTTALLLGLAALPVVALATETCAGLEATITGSEGSDNLRGTAGNDVVLALGGNDRVDGGAGNDVVCGGDGNDVLFGGDGDDRFYGGSGHDAISGGPGNDVAISGDGNGNFSGGSGFDICDDGACEASLEDDSDGDGLSNGEELETGTDPLAADTDGDGSADGAELENGTDPSNGDTDGDGYLDGADPQPLDLCVPEASAGSCDADGDGESNATDPDDDNVCVPTPDEPQCDADGDGEPNSTDPDDDNVCVPTPDEPQCDADGDGEPNSTDPDDDNVCVPTPDEPQCDADGDGEPGSTDPDDADACVPTPDEPACDSDGDGEPNGTDNCPSLNDASQADVDGDGMGDPCDEDDADGPLGDLDGDGEPNGTDDDDADKCVPSPDEGVCDPDADGVPNEQDNCPTEGNAGQQDGDADGVGDACDSSPNDGPSGDVDADGTVNSGDPAPSDPCRPNYYSSACSAPRPNLVLLGPDGSVPMGTCEALTLEAWSIMGVPDPVEGVPIDIHVTQSDADTDSDLKLIFCDPDGPGPGTNLGGSSDPISGAQTGNGPTPAQGGRDCDDDATSSVQGSDSGACSGAPGSEGPASIHDECVTDANGQCTFGISSDSPGASSIQAFVDGDSSDDRGLFEPFDSATITWVAHQSAGPPAAVACSPSTVEILDGSRHRFSCTVTDAGGNGIQGATVMFDVTSGPNAEEIGPTPCGPTDGSGVTPPLGYPGHCGYFDNYLTGTAASPTGTDTISVWINLPGRPGAPAPTAGPDAGEPATTISATWVAANADLVLRSWKSQPDPAPGSTFEYVYRIRNVGPDDTLPNAPAEFFPSLREGVQIQDMSSSDPTDSCTVDENPSCDLGAIASGSETVITVEVMRITSGAIHATAEVMAARGLIEPTYQNNSVGGPYIGVYPGVAADLAVSVDAPASPEVGEGFTYTVRIENQGPNASSTSSLSMNGSDLDPSTITSGGLDAGCEAGEFSPVVCDIPPIEADQSISFDVPAVRPHPSRVYFSASAYGVSDPYGANNTGEHWLSASGSVANDVRVTSLTASSDPDLGESFGLETVVLNNGPNIAENVTFRQPIWDGMTVEGFPTVESALACGVASDGRTIECTLGDLDPGESFTVAVTVRRDVGRALYTSADAWAEEWSRDVDFDNNGTYLRIGPVEGTGYDLSIVRTGPSSPGVGETFTYQLVVTNAGPDLAKGAFIAQALQGLTVLDLSIDDPAGNCSVGDWGLRCFAVAIDPGETVIVEISARRDNGQAIVQHTEVTTNGSPADGEVNEADNKIQVTLPSV